MLDMIRHFQNLRRRNEEGASAVEYGLLVALIAAVIVIAVWAVGSLVQDAFSDTCGDIQENSANAGQTVTSEGGADCAND